MECILIVGVSRETTRTREGCRNAGPLGSHTLYDGKRLSHHFNCKLFNIYGFIFTIVSSEFPV